MKKKLLATIFLVLSMVLSACGNDSSNNTSEKIKEPKIEVEEQGICGADAYWEYGNGILVIKGTGDMTNYHISDDNETPWYHLGNKVSHVYIMDGITSIGDYAFGCKYISNKLNAISKVIIADTVTSIGNGAFKGCSSLESITIPNSVTSIGGSAFKGCSSLESITIPESVTSIGNEAFSLCKSLGSISIPESVTSIGNEAFSYCESLESINLPESITNINIELVAGTLFCEKQLADNNCVILNGVLLYFELGDSESVVIPNTVTGIAEHVFYLTDPAMPEAYDPITYSITIPDTVTSIDDYAFVSKDIIHIYYNGTAEGAPWGAKKMN